MPRPQKPDPADASARPAEPDAQEHAGHVQAGDLIRVYRDAAVAAPYYGEDARLPVGPGTWRVVADGKRRSPVGVVDRTLSLSAARALAADKSGPKVEVVWNQTDHPGETCPDPGPLPPA